ncbi:hydroxysteroid dehydrogenase 2 [Brachionus plicatilis]|uniref:Hydroxysteroid dehydrogenase-like protein 2 n=1 Tax=Brachionus plicatilis TaxID=10195 RepID=A0A3M7TAK6_BRAPC|nr:hydroxysteroid dehydrogenase 2 [Brachionus plicatilis]
MIKNLAGKTIFITGASRGIGKAIALRCARDGANVIIAAKTAEPHPKLPGTIYTAAKEIEEVGGQALPCIVDVRFEDQVAKALEDGAKKFGGIDILVNNASAISLTGTLDTTMKKYDLMNQVNARGTFLCSKMAIPYLRKSSNPHILNLSPPLNLNPKWFKNNLAYTMAKYGMSFCVLGMSEELKEDGIAVNALWPRTAIATDAIDLIGSVEMRKQSRTTDIMADAAYQILIKESKTFSGKFLIDEDVLKNDLGMTNFDNYAVEPGSSLLMDFFLDEVEGQETLALGTNEASSDTDVSASMNALRRLLSPELVQKINGVYAFKITDAKTADWYLDLKNGSGKIDSGVYNGQVNCTMTMSSDIFNKMTSGALKPTMAFMSGKLKIKGEMGLAMKLEKLMSSLKSKL